MQEIKKQADVIRLQNMCKDDSIIPILEYKYKPACWIKEFLNKVKINQHVLRGAVLLLKPDHERKMYYWYLFDNWNLFNKHMWNEI
jgi:hypothetical protein